MPFARKKNSRSIRNFKNLTKPLLSGLPEETERLLTLCYCSLIITCTESKNAESQLFDVISGRNLDTSVTIKGSDVDEKDFLEYVPITRIPANIAKIFWSELLDIEGLIKDGKSDEEVVAEYAQVYERHEQNNGRIKANNIPENDDPTYWREFLYDDERKALYDQLDLQQDFNKFVKDYELNDLENYTDYNTTDNFAEDVLNICGPLSYSDTQLIERGYFQYIRDSLKKSDILHVFSEEKDVMEFVEDEAHDLEMNKLNHFLNRFGSSSMKEIFNPEKIVEFLRPTPTVDFSENNGKNQDKKVHPLLQHARRSSLDFRSNEKKNMPRRNSLTNINVKVESSYNYCFKLLKLGRAEGGLSLFLFSEDKDFYAHKIFPSSFVLWNNVMAEACLKLYNPYYSSSPTLQCAIVSLDAKEFEIEIKRKSRLENRTCYHDYTLAYAMKMLPSHLMRANRLMEAIELLQSYDFIFSRLVVLGAEEGSRRVRQDCEELRLRLIHEDSNTTAQQDVAQEVYNNPKKVIMFLLLSFKDDLIEKISPVLNINQSELGSILHTFGMMIERMGWIEEALEFFETALTCKNHTSNNSTMALISTLSKVSDGLLAKKKYEEALEFLAQKLSLQKEGYGVYDLDISKTLKNMAVSHRILGHQQQAISFYEEVLITEVKILGDQMEAYDTFNSLGHLYSAESAFEKAMDCFGQALRIVRLNLGKDHALVDDAHFNLGLSYSKLDNYDQAIHHISKCLIWRTKNLSESDDKLGRAIHTIGSLYLQLDDEVKHVDKALIYLEYAIELTRRNFDANNDVLARRLITLAEAYKKRGQLENELKVRGELVKIFKANHGEFHATVANALRDQSMIYKNLNQDKDSLSCLKQVIEILNHKEEDDFYNLAHSFTATYANLYLEMGKCCLRLQSYDEASEYLENAQQLYLEFREKDHVDVAETIHWIGVIHLYKEDEQQALKNITLAMNIRISALGNNHEKVADSLYYLAQVHKSNFDYSQSLHDALESINILENIKGIGLEKVARGMYFVASLNSFLGEYSEALRYFEDTKAMYEKMNNDNKKQQENIGNVRKWISFLEDRLRDKETFDDKIDRQYVPILDAKVVDLLNHNS